MSPDPVASPFATLSALPSPSTTEFPVTAEAGTRFEDEETGAGRLVLLATPQREDRRATLFVEAPEFSVGFHLTSGQLHRLANGLCGRGRRNAIRPHSLDEEYVHVTGEPEQLTVEYRDQTVRIPAGPRRALGKALREIEQRPA